MWSGPSAGGAEMNEEGDGDGSGAVLCSVAGWQAGRPVAPHRTALLCSTVLGVCCRQTSSAGGGPLLTSSLKTTNGLTSGAALDLQSTADLHGLFLAHQQPQPQPQLVKREPEDLSHRAKQPDSPPDQQHQPTNGIIKIAGEFRGRPPEGARGVARPPPADGRTEPAKRRRAEPSVPSRQSVRV